MEKGVVGNHLIKRQGLLLCLVGPAGSGKTTIGERVLAAERGALRQSVSVTSRQPRHGEVEGAHYHFISRGEFEARRDRGEFFEYEEIHENYYGTPRAPIEAAIAQGSDLLLIIDIRGALTTKRTFPLHTVIIFVTPYSSATLLSRIERRGGATQAEIERRLATARAEYNIFLGSLCGNGR